eukprot:5140997-Prymnesium_polylepis.2
MCAITSTGAGAHSSAAASERRPSAPQSPAKSTPASENRSRRARPDGERISTALCGRMAARPLPLPPAPRRSARAACRRRPAARAR